MLSHWYSIAADLLHSRSNRFTSKPIKRKFRHIINGMCVGLIFGLLLFNSSFANPQIDKTTEFEQCLLQALEKALPETTVSQLRLECAPKAQASPTKPRDEKSIFEKRLDSELNAWNQPFTLMAHRPNYLLPLTYQSRSSQASSSSQAQSAEAVFQISFKFPLAKPLFDGRAAPFFSYTGKSWWQVYDSDKSRPFREYNHEPEFFLTSPGFNGTFLGWKNQLNTLGFNHQSNGRSGAESRSWNRITNEYLFDNSSGSWSAIKLWYRIPEKSKQFPNDPSGDDNPDIHRYLGYGEFRLGHIENKSNLTATFRKSFQSNGKGSVQLDWSRPTSIGPAVRWYAHYFDGYGESLIDYNQRRRRLGLGIMINDWF
jgi:phospholipase A1/A2